MLTMRTMIAAIMLALVVPSLGCTAGLQKQLNASNAKVSELTDKVNELNGKIEEQIGWFHKVNNETEEAFLAVERLLFLSYDELKQCKDDNNCKPKTPGPTSHDGEIPPRR